MIRISRECARIARTVAPALLLALAALPASAQGWLAGGSIGQATQQDYDVGGPVSKRDDSDDSLRVFGGYLVSPMQGVIVSLIDLGTAYYDGPAFGGFTDELSAEAIDISYIVGWTPGMQQRVSVFGTAGIVGWDQDVRYTDISGTYIYNDEGTSFSVGVGTEINLSAAGTSRWGVHVEYQVLKDVGDADNSGHEYDREIVSVGASYRFGRN